MKKTRWSRHSLQKMEAVTHPPSPFPSLVRPDFVLGRKPSKGLLRMGALSGALHRGWAGIQMPGHHLSCRDGAGAFQVRVRLVGGGTLGNPGERSLGRSVRRLEKAVKGFTSCFPSTS